MTRWAWGAMVVAVLATAPSVDAGTDKGKVKLEGYAEWRRGDTLIVDGQRVRLAAGAEYKGHGEAKSFARIPLGYEIKAEGTRGSDGSVLATRLEAKPNGVAFFEADLRQAFDETEREFRRRGRVFEEDDDGQREDIGRLLQSGPRVQRARRILDELVPPYASRDDFRLYVVDNKEWNAMAAPNGAIFVFTGLMDDLDDDELAIVLGHELAHATHEHSRKAFKKDLPLLLGMIAVAGVAEAVDDGLGGTAVQVGAYLTYAALSSGYGRHQEDQADRSGLRYAYEAGYDIGKAPGLWRRFADKYGNGIPVVDFFFSEHSKSLERASNLEREIAVNYAGADAGVRTADRTPARRPAPRVDDDEEDFDDAEDSDDSEEFDADEDFDDAEDFDADDTEESDVEDGAVWADAGADDARPGVLLGWTVGAQGDEPVRSGTQGRRPGSRGTPRDAKH